MSEFKYITHVTPRIEGRALGLGRPVYMADSLPQDALVVKLIQSPYPHAEVESIDTAVAKKVPGVVDIYTWEDTNDRMLNFGWNYTAFEQTLIKKVALFEGDTVAIVVAENQKAAEKAARLVKIKWNVLEPLMDFRKALNNPLVVHHHLLDRIEPNQDVSDPKTCYDASINRVYCWDKEFGQTDKVLSECDAVTTVKAYTPQQVHSQLETHRCYTYYDDRGYLVVQAPTQAVSALQDNVAYALGIDRRRVRVFKTQVGGGFGGKNIFSVYCYCAYATFRTKRPCYLIYTRKFAQISIGSRHEYELDMTMGASKDGIIRAIDVSGYQNAGAYSEISEDVLGTGIKNTYGLMPRVEALRIHETSVFTNKLEGCAFRGFGATQNCFVLNVALRHLAEKLNMPLDELMLKNIAKVGDSHPVMNGWMEDDPAFIGSSTLPECIQRAKELIGWEEKRNRTLPEGNIVRGIGIGIASHASGVPRVDRGNVNITMNADGSFCVFSGHSDIGTGSNTVMLQIVAEVLDVPIQYIHLKAADTECTPYDPGTYASSNTYRCGSAAKMAAERMKKLLYSCVREMSGMAEDEPLIFKDDTFYKENGERLMDLVEFANKRNFYWGGGDPLVVSASFPDTFAPSPYVASCVEVEIDKETGYYQLKNMSVVVDAGRVINPGNARVQALGGTAQSIGMTMFEQVLYDEDTHKVINHDFQTYKIPAQMDMPPIQVEFIESYEPTGPFGAKSLGEIATGAPAPAITDALFNALGIHFDQLPVTPEKVLKAIQAKERGE